MLNPAPFVPELSRENDLMGQRVELSWWFHSMKEAVKKNFPRQSAKKLP